MSPDLGVLIDGDGRPVCSEMWPGNTADVSTSFRLWTGAAPPLRYCAKVRGRRPAAKCQHLAELEVKVLSVGEFASLLRPPKCQPTRLPELKGRAIDALQGAGGRH